MLVFAIPNGGKRSITTAMQLKAEGVAPGVPDLFIPELKLFIEMKRQQGGRVSKEQKEVIAELTKVGYQCLVCKGFEDAKEQLEKII